MRLFVGIEFPPEVVDVLVQCQEKLRQVAIKGRFKRSENFHLTLKFIGEVDKSRVPGLAAVLTNVARSLGPFSLKLGRLGKFNKGNAIRVVWLGVGGDCEQLAKLQTQIEGGLATLGITPEARQWRPHVTLAQDVEFVADDVFNSCLAESGAFDVGEFALVLSEERDRRRVYTPLYRFALTNNKA